jgi:hypothetical protein
VTGVEAKDKRQKARARNEFTLALEKSLLP